MGCIAGRRRQHGVPHNDVAPVFALGDIREKEVRRLKDRDRLAQEKKMAEAHDLALQLMEKAEAMERELQEGKKRLTTEMQKVHGRGHGPDVVQEQREEIARLRTAVSELRQKIENR